MQVREGGGRGWEVRRYIHKSTSTCMMYETGAFEYYRTFCREHYLVGHTAYRHTDTHYSTYLGGIWEVGNPFPEYQHNQPTKHG